MQHTQQAEAQRLSAACTAAARGGTGGVVAYAMNVPIEQSIRISVLSGAATVKMTFTSGYTVQQCDCMTRTSCKRGGQLNNRNFNTPVLHFLSFGAGFLKKCQGREQRF